MIAEVDILKSIISVLKKGGVILAPTDTVWGLMCDFESQSALDKILRLKHSRSRPIALLYDDWRKLELSGCIIPEYAAKLAIKFWPGAMTLVLRSTSSRIHYVSGSDGSIGIRIPNVAGLLELIREFGKPLAATSANFTGQNAAAILSQIPDEIKNGVDAIYDLKIKSSGMASTVIDCTGESYKIIRQGDINIEDIDKAILG
jgi:tRNA threonylcarbamoyl adenosine modification protein (Sua5/YciO/YrdC/YwlC family)